MKQPQSVKGLEKLGRTRLSKNFFLRDFLYSEVAQFYGGEAMPIFQPSFGPDQRVLPGVDLSLGIIAGILSFLPSISTSSNIPRA